MDARVIFGAQTKLCLCDCVAADREKAAKKKNTIKAHASDFGQMMNSFVGSFVKPLTINNLTNEPTNP
jgi:hypothetical protein